MKKKLLMMLLSIVQLTAVWGQNIFVSPTGNDLNAGTREKPIQSIKKAQELLRSKAGKKEVQVIFADGIYYLSDPIVLTADFSGTETKPVVFRAENEGKAIISGGNQIELKWEPFKNGIFKAIVSEDAAIDQLYVNGQRQRMARFPNAVEGKNVFDTWDLVHTNKPDTINDPLDKKRIATWSHPEGAYIHAMHNALWGDMHWIVKGKNVDGSLDLEGGWQNNRPSAMHPRYRIVENVFEELDAPGEWYYNKGTKTLYFYPETGLDLSKAKVEIVRLRNLIDFKGTKEKPVRFVRFDGFVFRHTARTFMDNKEPLLRSDWTTYRGGAVMFNGAVDCAVINCEFDQVGGNSVFVNNYNRRILVKSCYIHHSGANGVAFVGDPATVRSPLFRYGNQDFASIDRTPGPKGDNYPEDCRVEDCLITMTGRVEKQTAPVEISISHKITVSHCSIYDVPRAGINIDQGTFGGHVIEYCDVFNTVLETGDHGSFNSWGRDRFWTPEIKETDVEVQKDPGLPFLDMLEPNILRNSRWRCDHGWDIDLDDGSTWYKIYNNVLLNGGLKMREGYKREATNNVIINNSLHPHVWYPNSNDVFAHNIVFGAYKPAVMGRVIGAEGKWGAEIDSNLFATNLEDRAKFLINGCDKNSLVGDPMFIDAEKGDFSVENGSPALQMGFKNFPMDEFGVTSEKLKKIAKQPVIPVLITNQKDNSGQTYQWYGATLKNVETLGEQSAAGLPEISGVILLDVPANSAVAKSGLKVGDVIQQCQEVKIQNFKQMLQVAKDFQYLPELKLVLQRNQVKEIVMFGIQ
ncbi:MAG TPA: right-handed parallel beta-helix repeat-containing protein [Prolixibacteraceae bacterium]|nr:right-handed parallel beta-helix repeat-containing protein [Prolixibacteraceae bacterium]